MIWLCSADTGDAGCVLAGPASWPEITLPRLTLDPKVKNVGGSSQQGWRAGEHAAEPDEAPASHPSGDSPLLVQITCSRRCSPQRSTGGFKPGLLDLQSTTLPLS